MHTWVNTVRLSRIVLYTNKERLWIKARKLPQLYRLFWYDESTQYDFILFNTGIWRISCSSCHTNILTCSMCNLFHNHLGSTHQHNHWLKPHVIHKYSPIFGIYNSGDLLTLTFFFFVNTSYKQAIWFRRMSNHFNELSKSINLHSLHTSTILRIPQTNLSITWIRVELKLTEWIQETTHDPIFMSDLSNNSARNAFLPKHSVTCKFGYHRLEYSIHDKQINI